MSAVVISLGLWIAYMHRQEGVTKIGWYIRTELAPRLGEGALNWEERHKAIPRVFAPRVPPWFIYLPFVGPPIPLLLSYVGIRGWCALHRTLLVWVPLVVLSLALFLFGLAMAGKLRALVRWAKHGDPPPDRPWWRLFRQSGTDERAAVANAPENDLDAEVRKGDE
jgi:hypothetical protein